MYMRCALSTASLQNLTCTNERVRVSPLAHELVNREDDTRPLLSALLGMVTEPYQRMHAEGKAIHAILFGSILDWCIELFALVGLISLTSRLLSAWLLGVAILTAIPLIGAL